MYIEHMATTTTCQGFTQKGEQCQLPASRSPADDPRFCHRFHQPKGTRRPQRIQQPQRPQRIQQHQRTETRQELPLLGTGEVEAICQQMINQRRYQDVVNLMRASKSHRAVCQKLMDQAYQTELCQSLNHFLTTRASVSATEGGCRALNTYIIQPLLQVIKKCPPEQNDTDIESTVAYLRSVLHLPYMSFEFSGDQLEYRFLYSPLDTMIGKRDLIECVFTSICQITTSYNEAKSISCGGINPV